MNANTAAVRILALALLGCSISRAVGARIGHPHTPQITIHGDTPDPDTGRYVKSYGEHILINCFSESSNLTIRKDGIPQHVTVLNNTVQFYEENPPIGTYTYSCSDSENRDSLSVSFKPAMFLKSAMAQHKFDQEFGLHMYFVAIGYDYEVICNGDNSEALRILLNKRIPLQTQIVNATTVKCTEKAENELSTAYFCTSKTEDVMIVVSSGYFPEAQNFQCIIYHTKELNCGWTYSYSGDSFKLFYTDNNRAEFTILLCADHFSKRRSKCNVNEYFMRQRMFFLNHNVTFTLSTCNEFVCNNQTFAMNTNSITQLPPLQAVRVRYTNQRGAVLTWEKSINKCVYKLQYQLRDFPRWQHVDTSSVRCREQCEYEILFPYPDAKYEVTVEVRLEEGNDNLWSEPTLLSVTTKPKQKCTCELQTPILSSDKISCKACVLSEDIVKNSLELKTKIKRLTKKLNKANELIDLLSKSKEISDRINFLG